MTAPANDREWFAAVDGLGAALAAAAREGNTARVDQLRTERNQVQSRRPTTPTR